MSSSKPSAKPDAAAGTRYAVTESGEVKEKASPKLLRHDLRVMPGDLITNDIMDPERVHEGDPEHVRDDLIHDWAKKLHAKEEKQGVSEEWLPAGHARLNQFRINIRRLSVQRAWIQTISEDYHNGRGLDLSVKHLWFPHDDHHEYELRDGNPPGDADRPKHLRGYRLHVDPQDKHLVDEVMRGAAEQGIEVDRDYWVKRQAREVLNIRRNPEVLKL